MLAKIVITLLVIAAVIGVLVVCSCCVVAKRADDTVEKIWRDRQ